MRVFLRVIGLPASSCGNRAAVSRQEHPLPGVEIIHSGDQAVFEFLFGCDADVAQDGAGEFGKEALDEIEPGAVLRSGGGEINRSAQRSHPLSPFIGSHLG